MKLRWPWHHRRPRGLAQLLPIRPRLFERPAAPRELTHDEYRHILRHGTCPYCHSDLYAGPQGGMSTNLLCDSTVTEMGAVVQGCGARFNVVADFGPRNSMFGQVTQVSGRP